jgi:protochlorophyllide reductase
MKTFLLLTTLVLPASHAFQFMKGWKMPTYDPYEEAVKEKFGDKKLVVLTGCSSGLGRKTALALLGTGEYHVVGAVRDLDKMEAVAEVDGFDMDNFTPMYCELNSFDSVRKFCDEVDKFRMSKPIDRLICNAGVYQPSLPYPKWSLDNHEQTMQINFLSHFLMISKLMDSMMDSTDPRVVMVGSVTGNDNTVGGGGVYPIADLHDLAGFKKGFKNPISMADGYSFLGAKSYKDSKLCLMMMANFLHTKYHKLTGISFSSMYPGCIAESPLFREKRAWFRKYFPVFMKFITGGYVGEHEAGQRLMQTAHDPRCSKSGVYWSWNGGPREGRGKAALEMGGQISGGGGAGGGWDSIYENDQSAKVLDLETQMNLYKYATEITNAEWPELRQIVSPCPTLKVIGAVTKGMTKREELKRVRESSRSDMGEVEEVQKPTKKQRVVMATDRVVSGVLSNTVGRVARFAGKRLLGEFPEEAVSGSYHDDATKEGVDLEELDVDQQLLEKEVAEQLTGKETSAAIVDEEDEALFREIYNAETSITNKIEQDQEKRAVSA